MVSFDLQSSVLRNTMIFRVFGPNQPIPTMEKMAIARCCGRVSRQNARCEFGMDMSIARSKQRAENQAISAIPKIAMATTIAAYSVRSRKPHTVFSNVRNVTNMFMNARQISS